MSNQTTVLDKSKCFQLVLGTFGIYFSYLAIGLIQQWLIKFPYTNISTGKQQIFASTVSLVLYPHIATLIIGSAYNHLIIPKQERTKIPNKNSMICAFLVLIGGITFNYAIRWTSYPIVITVKSCNVLSVILVGTLCSRVKDKKLQLSPKKIFVGIIVTIGILLFKLFDPEVKQGQDKKFQILGFLVLFISLFADGFLPDFQAEIKSKFNPKPTEMMVQINKWVSIFCGTYIILAGEPLSAIQFALNHELFAWHLGGLSLLVCFGHFIIYRMIKSFKQHIVPFIITTRKVFTVCISLVYYEHKTHFGQILGIIIVLGVVLFQFINQLRVPNLQKIQQSENTHQKINFTEYQIEELKQKQQISKQQDTNKS